MYKGRRIKDFSEIKIDREMFDFLVHDRENRDPLYLPASRWEGRASPTDKNSHSQSDNAAIVPNTLENNLIDWVGQSGICPASPEHIQSYIDFIQKLGEKEILGRLDTNDSGLIIADLNTFMDLATLNKFVFSNERKDHITVLEVGGGYGRLAEGLLAEFPVIDLLIEVDSVIDSLCYCYSYLEVAFPEKQIMMLGYHSSPVQECDVVVCPSWRMESLKLDTVELFINISSFQEMYDEQVKMYVEWWQSLSLENSMFYISNSRDFYYRRNYEYPQDWELLYKARTPRSNTPDFPTEVMRRMPAHRKADNEEIENRYRQEIILVYREALAQEKMLKLKYMKASQAKQKIIDSFKQEI